MDKKKLFIIGGGALALALILGLAFFAFRGNGGGRRDNTLRLAGEYIEKGEYQRALDLLDRLLIDDPDDEAARALRDEALEGKRLAELRRADGSALTAGDIARLLEEFRANRGSGGLAGKVGGDRRSGPYQGKNRRIAGKPPRPCR